MAKPTPSDLLIKNVRERHPETILSFSLGKDSIACYLALQGKFERIIPFYLYLVPGLEFVEEAISYFEGIMGTHIVQLPHPSLYRMLNNFVFQPPERVSIIRSFDYYQFNYEDVYTAVREDYNAPGAPVAIGTRACDSPVRRIQITKNGPWNHRWNTYQPVWDWNKAKVLAEISAAGISLPVDYEIFGRSFDGLDYRFLGPIKKRFPKDYEKILEWFPLAELEVFRHERLCK